MEVSNSWTKTQTVFRRKVARMELDIDIDQDRVVVTMFDDQGWNLKIFMTVEEWTRSWAPVDGSEGRKGQWTG